MTVAHNTTTREQFWQYSLLLVTSNHCSAVCECFCHSDCQLVTHCLSQVTEVTPAPASKVGDPNMCHNSKAHQCISTNYILLNWRTMPHSAQHVNQHVNQDWTWLTPNWSTDSRTVSDMFDWLIGHGFTSAPTQYRLYGRRFLQVWWPNQQCQSTEGGWLGHPDRPQSNHAHLTVLQYYNMQILYKKIIIRK